MRRINSIGDRVQLTSGKTYPARDVNTFKLTGSGEAIISFDDGTYSRAVVDFAVNHTWVVGCPAYQNFVISFPSTLTVTQGY